MNSKQNKNTMQKQIQRKYVTNKTIPKWTPLQIQAALSIFFFFQVQNLGWNFTMSEADFPIFHFLGQVN